MRQWELIGITDQVPVQYASRSTSGVSVESNGDEPLFFWSTDAALRLLSVSGAAAEVIGRPTELCRGRDLLEIFGLEGSNAMLLDAHIAALNGDLGTFAFAADRVSVHCRVGPVTDPRGKATGTYCVAMRISHVDIVDWAARSAVA